MKVSWNIFIKFLQQVPRINTNSEVFFLKKKRAEVPEDMHFFHSSFPNTIRLSGNNQRQNHHWGNNQQKKKFEIRLIFAITSRIIQLKMNMLDFLRMISWANVFKYASETLVANDFNGLTFECRNQSSKCNYFWHSLQLMKETQ